MYRVEEHGCVFTDTDSENIGCDTENVAVKLEFV
jgi:hypothetical protein